MARFILAILAAMILYIGIPAIRQSAEDADAPVTQLSFWMTAGFTIYVIVLILSAVFGIGPVAWAIQLQLWLFGMHGAIGSFLIFLIPVYLVFGAIVAFTGVRPASVFDVYPRGVVLALPSLMIIGLTAMTAADKIDEAFAPDFGAVELEVIPTLPARSFYAELSGFAGEQLHVRSEAGGTELLALHSTSNKSDAVVVWVDGPVRWRGSAQIDANAAVPVAVRGFISPDLSYDEREALLRRFRSGPTPYIVWVVRPWITQGGARRSFFGIVAVGLVLAFGLWRLLIYVVARS